MATKLFAVILLSMAVSQGYGFTLYEETLADAQVSFISHPFYSRSLTIPKFWFDKLLTCHIVYPNGVMYEAYPNNNIPDNEITYMSAVEPFNACAVAFVHSDRIGSFSGSYELRSLVQHQDTSMTLTNQKFHVSITVSEVGIPTK